MSTITVKHMLVPKHYICWVLTGVIYKLYASKVVILHSSGFIVTDMSVFMSLVI